MGRQPPYLSSVSAAFDHPQIQPPSATHYHKEYLKIVRAMRIAHYRWRIANLL
ncbi:MAG TPA: hypothetical protein VKT53_15100 [Candidatus Acidoferrum sp.]|nr:hypothetical protein [Candidatus Acidoferrum sp.]